MWWVPSTDNVKLFFDLITALFTAIAAGGIIIVGGGFLSRKKYELLLDFWYHVSHILEAAKHFTAVVKRRTEDEERARYHKTRQEHQNPAADVFRKLEILFDDDLVTKIYECFKIFQKIDFLDTIRHAPQISDDEFYDYNQTVRNYEAELKSALKRELRKARYWFLR